MKLNFLTGTLLLFFSMGTLANDINFSEVDSPRKEIETSQLRWKLEIQGDILVFNKTGTRLIMKFDQERKWRFSNEKPITSYWSAAHKGQPSSAFYHEWQMNDLGELKLKFEQYESMTRNSEGGVKTGKLIQQKDFTIENMNAPSIVLFQDETKRIVVQFKIQIWAEEAADDIGKLGINSNRMIIYDNKGTVWASKLDNSSGDNVYYGITTHMGSLYMSYLPFPGAKKIGVAEKNRIRLEQGKLKVVIESGDMFLPRGTQANVYGFIDLNKRTDGLNQVQSYGSNKEANFLKNIKR